MHRVPTPFPTNAIERERVVFKLYVVGCTKYFNFAMLLAIFAICISIVCLVVGGKDLYATLGVKRSATKQEIKKAYRQKAKDTHPDKNPGVDTETAATQFREIAEAYEVLSDEKSRVTYDRTGKTERDLNEEKWNNQRNQRSNQRQSSGWSFGNFWNFNQQRQKPGVKYHRYFMDGYTRRAILNSQSRVLTVTGLSHLQDIALDDDTGLTERYVLLAVYDSRIASCEDTMNFYVMYPWPFAGFAREGDNSMWWEETMITTKIDLADNTEGSKQVQDLLNINFNAKDKKSVAQCPTIAFFPRKSNLQEFELWNPTLEVPVTRTQPSSDFRSWVWQRLKMSIKITNRTPWTLKQWWLDGFRGVVLDDIAPEATYSANTFLSHAFVYRASFVEGNLLNNQSSIFWYTSRMQDDGQEISIYPRCFDHHSDCDRWAKEGFCDKNSRESRRNKEWHEWCSKNCFVSCSLAGCSTQ